MIYHSPEQVVFRHYLESSGHGFLFIAEPGIQVHATNTI